MLKPHDIIVALKLLRPDPATALPTYASLSTMVGLSASETHASVARGLAAGLLRRSHGSGRGMPLANQSALREFLVHGLKYVWPGERGPITRGIPTSTSNPAVAALLSVPAPAVILIWPHAEGTARGETVEPLHPRATVLCANDPDLYLWLSLIDVIRLRAGREAALAASEIERRLR